MDLVHYDKESHGYPKGTNVSRVFGRVVLINHFKHKPDKNYYLSATIKSKYEIKLVENDKKCYDEENVDQFTGMYRNHLFDYPNHLKSHRVRRDDITTGLAALRNTDGVRRWFRTIKSDILLGNSRRTKSQRLQFKEKRLLTAFQLSTHKYVKKLHLR